MTKLQGSVLAVVLVTGLMTAVLQRQTVTNLSAENRDLQAQLAELERVGQENARRSNSQAQLAPATLSREQESELLRLRSQAGQLRAQLQAAQAAAKGGAVSAVPKEPTPAGDEAPAQSYSAEFATRVPTGQSLLTGGWNTAPGMRTFVMVTPSALTPTGAHAKVGDPENQPSQTLLSSVIFEVPEKLLLQLGLDQLTSDSAQSPVQNLMGGANAKNLWDALKSTEGVNVISQPRVLTSDGVAASVFIGAAAPAKGSSASGSQSMEFTPHLAADGSGIDLAVKAAFTPPAAKSGGR